MRVNYIAGDGAGGVGAGELRLYRVGDDESKKANDEGWDGPQQVSDRREHMRARHS